MAAMREFTLKQRLLIHSAPPLAAMLLRSFAATWKVSESGETALSVRQPQPAARIYVYWHEFALAAVGIYRDFGIHPFASQSFDGELVSRTMDRMGFGVTARGSSSRGGAQGLLELKSFLDKGEHVGITVDGPRGPRRVAQLGALKLAQVSGCSVVPFTFAAKKERRLRSWDRMLIPLPLMQGVVCFGAELKVAKEQEDLSASLAQLQTSFDSICSQAESLAAQL